MTEKKLDTSESELKYLDLERIFEDYNNDIIKIFEARYNFQVLDQKSSSPAPPAEIFLSKKRGRKQSCVYQGSELRQWNANPRNLVKEKLLKKIDVATLRDLNLKFLK